MLFRNSISLIRCRSMWNRSIGTNPTRFINIRASFQQQQQQQQQRTKQQLKDQFIHDQLNATAGGEQPDHSLEERDIIVKEPPRERYGVLKAVLIIVSGLYFGAWVAMMGAKLLEDLDIYVQDRDGDDD